MNRDRKVKKYTKQQLVEKLCRIPKETGVKEQYWLEQDEMLQVVKLGIADFVLFNKPTEDHLFKSRIVFDGCTFVNISKKKISNPKLLSIVK